MFPREADTKRTGQVQNLVELWLSNFTKRNYHDRQIGICLRIVLPSEILLRECTVKNIYAVKVQLQERCEGADKSCPGIKYFGFSFRSPANVSGTCVDFLV